MVKIRQKSPSGPEALGGLAAVHTGTVCQVRSTLMSAITRCRRVNSWLSSKRWALSGEVGDAVVEAAVDLTLMRGSDPHDR